jgi:hypothetical protein
MDGAGAHWFQGVYSLYLVMTPIAYSLADVAVLMGPRIAQHPTDICPYAYRMARLLDKLRDRGLLEQLTTDFTINNLGIDPGSGKAVVGGGQKGPSGSSSQAQLSVHRSQRGQPTEEARTSA